MNGNVLRVYVESGVPIKTGALAQCPTTATIVSGDGDPSNVLTDEERDSNNPNNYWGGTGPIVIDLGAMANIHAIYIRNSHNGLGNSRYFEYYNFWEITMLMICLIEGVPRNSRS